MATQSESSAGVEDVDSSSDLRQRATKAGSDDANTENTAKQAGKKQASLRTLVVIEFSPSAVKGDKGAETLDWLIDKISASRRDGGAELIARRTMDTNKNVVTLHLSATRGRLLLGAELMEMKKPHRDGSLHEVSLDHLELFVGADDLDSFLTMAEQQRIVLHELESVRALESDSHIPGVSKGEVYTGEAIVPKLVQSGVISQIFPLHDRDELKVLASEWYQTALKPQPLARIQRYFGDSLAMYFSFLGFYTVALVPPALVGVVSTLWAAPGADLDLVVFFSVFNLLWTTLFLEAWKRNGATLAYQWGTINSEPFEEARAAYHGELGHNPVTDRLEPKYPKWRRVLKFYCVSVPTVLLCLWGAFEVMLYYFYWEGVLIEYDQTHSVWWSGYAVFIPTVVYSVVIIVLNALYRMLATALTDWENHRLESAYEKHLITKLVLFDFVNCFLSLFYIAFVLKDMKMLRTSLATLLIVQQIIQQCQETLLPYLVYKYRKTTIRRRHRANNASDGATDATTDATTQQRTDDEVTGEIEGTKDAYLGTLDDYLELFLQFGYVFLFSAVYPTAAFWALLNNVLEIRSDAFKMCRVFQRPFSRPTAGIGAWQLAFELLGVIAVMTNCALIGMSPHIKVWMPDSTEVDVLVFFIIAEHLILFLKLVLAYVIPDEPSWVQDALERNEYQAKKYWRKQRYEEAQKKLKEKE